MLGGQCVQGSVDDKSSREAAGNIEILIIKIIKNLRGLGVSSNQLATQNMVDEAVQTGAGRVGVARA